MNATLRILIGLCQRRIPTMPNPDVTAIREGLSLTRLEFAALFGVTHGALKKWELGSRNPSTLALIGLHFIEKYPELVLRELYPAVRVPEE